MTIKDLLDRVIINFYNISLIKIVYMTDCLHEYHFRHENIKEMNILAHSLKIEVNKVNIIEVNENHNLFRFDIKFMNYFLLL